MGDAVGPLTGLKPLNRGNSIVLSPPSADIDPATNVDYTVCETRSQCDVTAQDIGVVLGIELEGQSNLSQASLENSFVYPSVRAVIDWGIGGTSYSAELDYLLGTQICVCAETIRVGAKYMKNTLPWAPVTEQHAPRFRVSAAFAYGGNGHNSNPARLTELVQVDPNGQFVQNTQTIQIPQYAVSMTALVVSGEFIADVFGFGSNYAVRWIPYAAGNPPIDDTMRVTENSFPLFSGARYITVTNASAEGVGLIAFIIFGMAL